jgi:acetolactate synthase-1/2/3 large subunit
LLAGRELDVPGGRQALLQFAATWSLPVAVSFRRQDLFPNDHALYVGDLGLKNPDPQRQAFSEADLVLALGTRLTDITTQGYTWPTLAQTLVHTCADPRFLGWRFPATEATTAAAPSVIEALGTPRQPLSAARTAWIQRLRDIHRSASRSNPGSFPDGLDFRRIAQLIGAIAPLNAIVTLDVGTFAAPFYRQVVWRAGQRLLAPISGAMGFGVPAAVAAAMRHRDRPVICVVGDGGALMTGAELTVGMARGLPIKLIISENNSYGSIRIHQERDYPGRVSGTNLENPDLARWAASFGATVMRVDNTSNLEALAAALQAPGPLVALVRTSLQAVLPPTNQQGNAQHRPSSTTSAKIR